MEIQNGGMMRYIQKTEHKHCTSYNVRKWINNKLVFFGAFPNLDEARNYRDFLIDNDWDISLIHKPPLRYIRFVKGKYEVVVCQGTIRIYVGRFSNLEDAIYERDAFLNAGLDWDCYVDGTDDTIDGKIPPMKICTRNLWETKPRNDAYLFNASIKERY